MKAKLFTMVWFAVTASLGAATPVLQVMRSAAGGASLLRNGNFKQARDGQALEWRAAPQGYQVAPNEGRGGSQALRCQTASADGWAGASQTLTLNRREVAPLIVRGWSKAANVSGGTDSGYSLYVDIVYADGTPLWGQTGNFHCGTHDWEPREFVILPDQPVKSLTLHCIFRGHAGQVWFDDVSVQEVTAEGGAVLFQGVPMTAQSVKALAANANSPEAATTVENEPRKPANSSTLTTQDGLQLALHDQAVVGFAAADLKSPSNSPIGFLARDVAANSDVFAFENGTCAELGLRIEARFTAHSNHIEVLGRVTDLTGKDRAVTLLFGLPVDATGWHWGDDIRRERTIRGKGEFVNQVAVRCGATGTMSLYPVGAIWNDTTGLALALDLAQPAQYRVGYHAGLKLLFLAYDFGLVKDTERFPSSADFRFVIYRFAPPWGFRAAWQKYMEIFPAQFEVRSKAQGIWMPFTDVSKVADWQDFGFRYHEGNNNVSWDDQHGVLSFRYTEPMTWWMRMKKGIPRTMSEALKARDELANGYNDHQRQMARVAQVAGMFDETSQPALQFRDTPWCDGAVWSLNPNPYLGSRLLEESFPLASLPPKTSSGLTNAATVYWNDSIKQALYGPKAKGKLDGEYLDSLEGYVTADLNFRREHFRSTTVPLTFSAETKQPALFKGLAVFEFTRWMANDVHGLGKLMFANGVPYRFTFLCPCLDVMGTETDWLRAGKYQPADLARMDLWRTMSGQKPYLLLMNTDYDAFTTDRVEKYFQRSLFYGMWPSMFSHNAAENPYWQNPKWYNRDRALFKKYIPIIRQVAEAGWQPVTQAASDNVHISVERFGPDDHANLFFTAFNDTAKIQTGVLRPRYQELAFDPSAHAVELLSGQPPKSAEQGWQIRLSPQEVAVIRLSK